MGFVCLFLFSFLLFFQFMNKHFCFIQFNSSWIFFYFFFKIK
jgi:hypothetical protein